MNLRPRRWRHDRRGTNRSRGHMSIRGSAGLRRIPLRARDAAFRQSIFCETNPPKRLKTLGFRESEACFLRLKSTKFAHKRALSLPKSPLSCTAVAVAPPKARLHRRWSPTQRLRPSNPPEPLRHPLVVQSPGPAC